MGKKRQKKKRLKRDFVAQGDGGGGGGNGGGNGGGDPLSDLPLPMNEDAHVLPFKSAPTAPTPVGAAASTLARSKRGSNAQRQLTEWQDKMLRANEDRTITIKLVSDYAKFLASMRDKLERKMRDVEKKGKVLIGLIRSALGSRKLEYETNYYHNRDIGAGVYKDIEVLNLHINAWKSSNAFKQLMALGEDRCVRVGGSDEGLAQYIEKPEIPEMSFEELLAVEKESGEFADDLSLHFDGIRLGASGDS